MPLLIPHHVLTLLAYPSLDLDNAYSALNERKDDLGLLVLQINHGKKRAVAIAIIILVQDSSMLPLAVMLPKESRRRAARDW